MPIASRPILALPCLPPETAALALLRAVRQPCAPHCSAGASLCRPPLITLSLGPAPRGADCHPLPYLCLRPLLSCPQADSVVKSQADFLTELAALRSLAAPTDTPPAPLVNSLSGAVELLRGLAALQVRAVPWSCVG